MPTTPKNSTSGSKIEQLYNLSTTVATEFVSLRHKQAELTKNLHDRNQSARSEFLVSRATEMAALIIADTTETGNEMRSLLKGLKSKGLLVLNSSVESAGLKELKRSGLVEADAYGADLPTYILTPMGKKVVEAFPVALLRK